MRKKILYAASTASHLQRFHKPYIEALRRDADVHLMANGEGVEHPIAFAKSYFSLSNLRAWWQIRRILKRENYDLVILNTTLAAFWIRLAMLGMRRRPYVLNVVHGYLFPKTQGGLRGAILLFCEKLVKGMTDDILVMNREDLENAGEHRLCRKEVYFSYGMGLPADRVIPGETAVRRSLGLDKDSFVCTYVGELSKRKNQGFLIDAVHRLREEGSAVRLLLVGLGNEEANLKQRVADLGLEDRVFFLGHRDDIAEILSATDLYVSASSCEGLPFNLMEAMAAGLPVLASDVRGQWDLLCEQEGALYPLNDMEAFCQGIRNIRARGVYGKESVEYPALERYLLPSVLEENLKIFTLGLK
ncbi:MAG: glycosyltransferase [Clostridia bacterium]|nr:glycosyltransferase [Clostridia bacterium]